MRIRTLKSLQRKPPTKIAYYCIGCGMPLPEKKPYCTGCIEAQDFRKDFEEQK